MSHQLEIRFQYGDKPREKAAKPKLDLFADSSNIKNAAHRNFRERNSYASLTRDEKGSRIELRDLSAGRFQGK